MTTAPHTRRILSIYRSAGPDDYATGMAWYREANAYAASLDNDVERAAGVMAAISPMMPWPRNKILAAEIYNGRQGGCLPDNWVKARRILDGEAPLDVLSGDKVVAFFHNIMLSPEYVTIDRHAIDIAIGRPLSNKERSVWLGKRKRAVLVKAYENAAKIAGVSAFEIQAVTWVVWRKTRAVANFG